MAKRRLLALGTDTGTAEMTRSLAQQEQTARNLLRQAYALGWTTDEQVIAFAVEAMGEDAKTLVGRVFAREFGIHTG